MTGLSLNVGFIGVVGAQVACEGSRQPGRGRFRLRLGQKRY